MSKLFLIIEHRVHGVAWVVIDEGGAIVGEGLAMSVESAEHNSGLFTRAGMLDTRTELNAEDRESYYAARVAHAIADEGRVKLEEGLNVPEQAIQENAT